MPAQLPSRVNTFSEAKRYLQILFLGDRDVTDFELNELQEVMYYLLQMLVDGVLPKGAIISGLEVSRDNGNLTLTEGVVATDPLVAKIAAATLAFDASKDTGSDFVWLEVLTKRVSGVTDPSIKNIITGELAADRIQYEYNLLTADSSSDAVPDGYLERLSCIALYRWDRDTNEILPTVQRRLRFNLEDLNGNLDGGRITVSSISEDQLTIGATEGLTTLLDSIAQRTFDLAGSFLVRGMQVSLFLDSPSTEMISLKVNPGRGYVEGYRIDVLLPTTLDVPYATDVESVQNEVQRQSFIDNFGQVVFEPFNSPFDTIEDIRTTLVVSENLTKGSSDLTALTHATVVDIRSVTFGSVTYGKGDGVFAQQGNSIHWINSSVKPSTGATFSITYEYFGSLIDGGQYVSNPSLIGRSTDTFSELGVLGFLATKGTGTPNQSGDPGTWTMPPAGVYRYLISVEADLGAGYRRPLFDLSKAITVNVAQGEIVRFSYRELLEQTVIPILNAQPSSVTAVTFTLYRSINNTARNKFYANRKFTWVRNGQWWTSGQNPTIPTYFYDIGFPGDSESPTSNPPSSSSSDVQATAHPLVKWFQPEYTVLPPNSAIGLIGTEFWNNGLGGDILAGAIPQGLVKCDTFPPSGTPVSYAAAFSTYRTENLFIDYTFPIPRKDLVVLTRNGLQVIMGQSARNPVAPTNPPQALGLAVVSMPAGSGDATITLLNPYRVTQDRLRRMLQDIENLKYNDAINQINTSVTSRQATPQRGVFADDLSSLIQADVDHPDYDCDIDTLFRILRPPRSIIKHPLTPALGSSVNISRLGPHIFISLTEGTILEQLDWSEFKTINPLAATWVVPRVQILPLIMAENLASVPVIGSGFSPSQTNIEVLVGDEVVATGVHTDAQGRIATTLDLHVASRRDVQLVAFRPTGGQVQAQQQVTLVPEEAIGRVEDIVVRPESIATQPIDSVSAITQGAFSRPYVPEYSIERVPPEPVVQPVITASAVAPIGQTFKFTDSDRTLKAIGLYFGAKPSGSTPVTVEIQRCSNGLPNGEVLDSVTLSPSQVATSGETKITLNHPLTIIKDRAYAVVLRSNSSGYNVKAATVGSTGQSGAITRNVYGNGVFIEASQSGSNWAWTQAPFTDLTMRLYGGLHQATATLRFDALPSASFRELAIDEFAWTPEGTQASWEYSVNGGTTWLPAVPEERREVQSGDDDIELMVRANLVASVDRFRTPMLIDQVGLLAYSWLASGVYVTRTLYLQQAVSEMRLYALQNLPGGTSVVWKASNDGGSTWVTLAVVPSETRIIDDRWNEYVYTGTFADGSLSEVKLKCEMTGASTNVVPEIHRIAATFS